MHGIVNTCQRPVIFRHFSAQFEIKLRVQYTSLFTWVASTCLYYMNPHCRHIVNTCQNLAQKAGNFRHFSAYFGRNYHTFASGLHGIVLHVPTSCIQAPNKLRFLYICWAQIRVERIGGILVQCSARSSVKSDIYVCVYIYIYISYLFFLPAHVVHWAPWLDPETYEQIHTYIHTHTHTHQSAETTRNTLGAVARSRHQRADTYIHTYINTCKFICIYIYIHQSELYWPFPSRRGDT